MSTFSRFETVRNSGSLWATLMPIEDLREAVERKYKRLEELRPAQKSSLEAEAEADALRDELLQLYPVLLWKKAEQLGEILERRLRELK